MRPMEEKSNIKQTEMPKMQQTNGHQDSPVNQKLAGLFGKNKSKDSPAKDKKEKDSKKKEKSKLQKPNKKDQKQDDKQSVVAPDIVPQESLIQDKEKSSDPNWLAELKNKQGSETAESPDDQKFDQNNQSKIKDPKVVDLIADDLDDTISSIQSDSVEPQGSKKKKEKDKKSKKSKDKKGDITGRVDLDETTSSVQSDDIPNKFKSRNRFGGIFSSKRKDKKSKVEKGNNQNQVEADQNTDNQIDALQDFEGEIDTSIDKDISIEVADDSPSEADQKVEQLHYYLFY